MKGVVRPQARPTRRKPRVQLRMEGEEEEEGGGGGGGAVVDIVGEVGGGMGRGREMEGRDGLGGLLHD